MKISVLFLVVGVFLSILGAVGNIDVITIMGIMFSLTANIVAGQEEIIRKLEEK